jgi:quinol monooxygenase YgiN
MPDIRWTAAGEMAPGREYLVMASHLPLRSITSTPRFFRAVAAIREQLRGAEGLVGYTLRAKPLARRYWTLSVWTDRSALQAFMRTPPHVGVMGSLKPFMATTKFVQWQITAEEGRPGWNEALERLASVRSDTEGSRPASPPGT